MSANNPSAASDFPFEFLRMNRRAGKPRTPGVTEIRGPYYTPMGRRYLVDVLETLGAWVDALKFAGGSFALMPRIKKGVRFTFSEKGSRHPPPREK